MWKKVIYGMQCLKRKRHRLLIKWPPERVCFFCCAVKPVSCLSFLIMLSSVDPSRKAKIDCREEILFSDRRHHSL